ncbi:hypothetical protein AMAG_17789 [Allomyces macrogynus ATCC 38327]|uniref:Uncharacterized protein n=1 Tax=Allomyces macrogynus (strain ATCC 38327) TaxID=578462 RepID=A0A0L0RYS3_ALLM3|nr:hypothetical protein AMAG_17789 [Allomyces macrogynus ATCC 38327]|eukprot:KNE55483.1 hypothetical protein AMAG_17789 [Allomyces macrogynus ATCC 38327]
MVPGYLLVTNLYCIGDQFQVTINGQDNGLTSTPVAATCDAQIFPTHADSAMSMDNVSHGSYVLPAGTSTIVIATTIVPWGSGGWVSFKVVGLGVYIDPARLPPFKVVKTEGKVMSCAAAVAACKMAGMVLASVTSAN